MSVAKATCVHGYIQMSYWMCATAYQVHVISNASSVKHGLSMMWELLALFIARCTYLNLQILSKGLL